MWASGHYGDIRRAGYSYEPTREAAMQAFLRAGIGRCEASVRPKEPRRPMPRIARLTRPRFGGAFLFSRRAIFRRAAGALDDPQAAVAGRSSN
jgi:hypothetical protein